MLTQELKEANGSANRSGHAEPECRQRSGRVAPAAGAGGGRQALGRPARAGAHLRRRRGSVLQDRPWSRNAAAAATGSARRVRAAASLPRRCRRARGAGADRRWRVPDAGVAQGPGRAAQPPRASLVTLCSDHAAPDPDRVGAGAPGRASQRPAARQHHGRTRWRRSSRRLRSGEPGWLPRMRARRLWPLGRRRPGVQRAAGAAARAAAGEAVAAADPGAARQAPARHPPPVAGARPTAGGRRSGASGPGSGLADRRSRVRQLARGAGRLLRARAQGHPVSGRAALGGALGPSASRHHVCRAAHSGARLQHGPPVDVRAQGGARARRWRSMPTRTSSRRRPRSPPRSG